MKRWAPWGVLGCAAGIWWCLSPGSLAVLGALLMTTWGLSRIADARKRRFLIRLFLAGFAVRAALSLGLDVAAWVVTRGQPFRWERPAWSQTQVAEDRTRRFLGMGDSDYYSTRAYTMALYAKGVRGPVTLSTAYRDTSPYGWNGYLYLLGLFYFLFGFSPFAIKLMTCWFGALIGPMLYAVGETQFSPPIARWAATLVAFFPSLVCWSATNLKDIPFIVLTLALLLLFMSMRHAGAMRGRAIALGLFLIVLAAHVFLRQGFLSFSLVGCLVVSSWLVCRMPRTVKVAVVLVVGVSLAVCVHARLRPMLAGAFYYHLGHVRTPGDSYRYLPQPFFDPDYMAQWAEHGSIGVPVLMAVGKAAALYLLEPLPGRVDTAFEILAYPQMVLWYFCLPLALWGMVVSLKTRPRDSLALVLLLITWVFGVALRGGNIGTAFRMRDMVSPLVLLFACVGGWAVVHGTQAVERRRTS